MGIKAPGERFMVRRVRAGDGTGRVRDGRGTAATGHRVPRAGRAGQSVIYEHARP